MELCKINNKKRFCINYDGCALFLGGKESMNIQLRLEMPEDYRIVEELTREVF
jgi:hypothetical protein